MSQRNASNVLIRHPFIGTILHRDGGSQGNCQRRFVERFSRQGYFSLTRLSNMFK
jgi:hypothetical protein